VIDAQSFAFDVISKVCFVERFLSTVVSRLNNVSFSREKMTSLHFTDTDITYVSFAVELCYLFS